MLNDIIADMLSNKNFQLIVTELSIRSRKLSISPVFIAHQILKHNNVLNS